MTTSDPESILTSLEDPTGPSISDIEDLAKQWDSGLIHSKTRGIAGLLLFCVAPEQSIRNRVPALKTPDTYLRDPDVKEALLQKYVMVRTRLVPPEPSLNWPKIFRDLTYHALGSKSIILKSCSKYALKIIKPWVWNVKGIKEATAEYGDQFGSLGSVCPEVYDFDTRWIIMDLIDGDPLTNYIKDHLHSPDPQDNAEVFLSQVQRIFTLVCDALSKCLQHQPDKKHHLDLSPDNILVSNAGKINETITLIDFEANHLPLTYLGAGGSLPKASTFLAPELREGAPGNELSDAYSLGLILLMMLAPGHFAERDPSTQLDVVWQRFPELAAIIEDMIDQRPANRLLQADTRSDCFDYLSASVTHANNLYIERHVKQPSSIAVFFEAGINGIVPVTPLMAAWQKWQNGDKEFKRAIEEKRVNKSLLLLTLRPLRWVFRWQVLASLINIVVISLLMWTTFIFFDSRLCDALCIAPKDIPAFPASWAAFFSKTGPLGKFSGYINGYAPGRLAALTFAIIFGKFYSEVFGSITLRYFKSPGLKARTRAPEVTMRAIPIVGLCTLLWGIVVDPKAWAFCAGFGLAFVGAANLKMLRFCQWALRADQTNLGAEASALDPEERSSSSDPVPLLLPTSPFVATKIKEFERWHVSMFNYSASLLILGFCLKLRIAQDEWLYATLAGIVVNLGQIYRIHCRREPPDLRTAFLRIVFRLRRMDIVRTRVMTSDVATAKAAVQ
jgi:serine/threonine protein kinase